MPGDTSSPGDRSLLPRLLATFAVTTVIGLVAATSSAVACGNAMRIVDQGLFPTMFYLWGAGALISLGIVFLDRFRSAPLSIRSRFMVCASIITMFSGAWTIYYGVTTDRDEWRAWDDVVNVYDHPDEPRNEVTF